MTPWEQDAFVPPPVRLHVAVKLATRMLVLEHLGRHHERRAERHGRLERRHWQAILDLAPRQLRLEVDASAAGLDLVTPGGAR